MDAEKLAAEAAARGDKAGETYWLHVLKLVNEAPPLGPETVARLQVLIWTDPEPHSTAA
ncbi:hypothetical protein QNO09_12815 [Streptomyces sp. 378]|uniref:hypothetical protein n=1 Tax=Streptomyces sp. 378 TaxID=3049412 RepID=UPI0024C3BED4|nr:hypothetical protein [Streptomyces sp. 378]MDK1344168.1 hypothetical protein [Streptomyces sp. 378]